VIDLVIAASTSQAGPLNPIQLENENQGSVEWIPTISDSTHALEGYASLASVNAGQSISFFIDSKDPQFLLAIYRLGYYQGRGGRLMTSPVTLDGRRQPVPGTDPIAGLVECRWTSPYVLNVPSNWTSGLYVAKLTATSSGVQRLIPFVVRNDDRFSDLIFQSSVATAEAYNSWGGKSLYGFNSTDGVAATRVSFNRPFDDSDGAGKFSLANSTWRPSSRRRAMTSCTRPTWIRKNARRNCCSIADSSRSAPMSNGQMRCATM
jgi:hypothetical protein